ncbi:type I phosphomannose isomerase catalytic subunit [Maribacter sp. 2307ULW6-5]|uniref:type I phosphomannose isomerase catalytic subunit n=1 Tax=Maribacter sp. 2307ULW6-5 TaxID=3386275 RepID=UPI0039BD1215
MQAYPLKFRPILKDRLWGGTKLRDVLKKEIPTDTTGESWEISTVPGDVSVVGNGAYAGKNIQELLEAYGPDFVGTSVHRRFGREFPILIKFIDAKQDLSVQLHPNDELAKERHNSFGKTEMWYVMDADPGAQLIVGFNKDVTKEEYGAALENDGLLNLLHYEQVTEGDTFFINTGKIHAIGAGVLLAEIQQTSDVTYRVFDFNRRDKDGNFRELHTDLALDAIDYKKKNDFKVSFETNANRSNAMVDCPYFKTQFLRLTQDHNLDTATRDSFTILMCVGGSGAVHTAQGRVPLQRGETVLVPACAERIGIETSGATFLEVTI